jgi:mono/diheme cytochrome c family protein
MLVRVTMAVMATVGAVSAQEPDSKLGQDLYMSYCMQCHGVDAKGDGPMAEMIAINTPDLSSLAERNDGTFPTEVVARQIDGRAPMLAHGGDMPIFGPFLESDRNVALRLHSGQTMMVGLPMANLVVYLESIQTK